MSDDPVQREAEIRAYLAGDPRRHPVDAAVPMLRDAMALLDAARSLPVLRTCGDCAHYADVRDGQCEHPAHERGFPETCRNDAPPGWCPLR
jgi:hypothetical protein